MLKDKLALLNMAFTLTLFSGGAYAGTLSAGFISFDQTGATTATFDVVNMTGANASAFPDTTFPITSTLGLSRIGLSVAFAGGGSVAEDATQFTADGSGGFTGTFNLDLTRFTLADAVLTGIFDSSLVQLNNGTTQEISTSFSATVSPSSGPSLQFGDFALITANIVPEPASWMLAFAGLLLVLRFHPTEVTRR